MQTLEIPFDRMTSQDKFLFLERVWQSLDSSDTEALSTPDWHLEELRRTEIMEARGELTFTAWESVKQRLTEQFP